MSARPTLYLHVGPHKTASTFLQVQFVEQAELAKSQGVLYPLLGREYLSGHHNLAWFFSKKRQLINTTRAELSANLSEFLRKGHDKVLLSSEEFVSLNEADLAELRRAFETYSIHVLFFRRTGSDLVVSLWQEKVKHGLTTPLDQFSPEHIGTKPFSLEYNIAKLKAGLSNPAITVFDYNSLRSQGPNRVLEEICHVLRIELRPSIQPVNTSLPVEIIELTRAANIFAKNSGFRETSQVRTIIANSLRGEFGSDLRAYAKSKVAKMSRCLKSKHLAEAGFPYDNSGTEWRYVPGTRLFDELNRDKNKLWHSLKQQLIAELSNRPHSYAEISAKPRAVRDNLPRSYSSNTQLEETGKIVIFGPYKSGTTALFHQVRNSLPANARTLFEASCYASEAGDRNRWVLAKVILGVQSDEFSINYDTFLSFNKQIYLIRDPRDWLISGLLFTFQQHPSIYNNDAELDRLVRLLREKEANPTSVSMVTIAEEVIGAIPNQSLSRLTSWMESHFQWLIEFEERLTNYYPLKYEDFVDKKITGLEKYLGIQLFKTIDFGSEHKHVARTKTHGDWRNWFLKEDIEYFRPLFDPYLKHYGYSTEWRLNDVQAIRPERASQYVERTVAMRKGL